GQAARNIGNETLQGLTLLKHCQGSILEGDNFGRPITILRRYPLSVSIRPDFQMRIRRNAPVLHFFAPSLTITQQRNVTSTADRRRPVAHGSRISSKTGLSQSKIIRQNSSAVFF